jgi:hypothetical protein
MAFTRFHDDPCRIQKQLQESTGLGRYMLNVPGNGLTPYYVEDPHIRLQKWGANLTTNTINVESDLRGLTRSINKDCLHKDNYEEHSAKFSNVNYPSLKSSVSDETRATHPAWMYRDLEQVNWYYLPLNPQENTCMPFNNNLNTRILEKDYYVPRPPPCFNNHI